jgi:hypothetical protein
MPPSDLHARSRIKSKSYPMIGETEAVTSDPMVSRGSAFVLFDG